MLLVGEAAYWLALAATGAIQVASAAPGPAPATGPAALIGGFLGAAVTLSWLECAAALAGAGTALWAAIAISRGSQAARVATQLLAWPGGAAGAALVVVGVANSSATSLASGVCLIAANIVIIWSVTQAGRPGSYPSAAASHPSQP